MNILLKRHEVRSLPVSSGIFVRVASGCVWLTRSGDNRDYFLRTGDAVNLDRGESAVLEALKESCVSVKSQSKVFIRL